MKILFLSGSPHTIYGGFEKVESILAHYLISKGHKVNILSLVAKKSEFDKKVLDIFNDLNVHRYFYKYRLRISIPKIFLGNMIGINYSPAYDEIKDYLQNKFEPDIIIVTNVEWIFGLSAKKALKDLNYDKCKVIWWPHSSLFPKLPIWMYILGSRIILSTTIKKLLKNIDAVLAISTGIKKQISKLNPNVKVYTVFNPLEPYNGELVLSSKIPTFLYVGRIEYRAKNLSFMFNGLSKVKRDWKLIIVGTGPDEDKLKNLANSLGISQKIEWMGFKKNPYENLNEGVTALLLTSRYEGFGMVLAEANQRGIPVISSDCQVGPSDIVIPGVNGYLYPEGDMDAFVKIINDVIDGKLNFGTPEEISKTAERFSEDVVCNNIMNALKKIESDQEE